MESINTSNWFYEFEYNGEKKRIHRFQHLPFDMAYKLDGEGENDVPAILAELLERDCGMKLSDFDYASMVALIHELSEEGESLGE